MKKLSVIYAGWGERFELGQLADNGTDLLFEYSALAQQRGLDLSPFKMPLASTTYGEFPAHQFRLPGLVSDALPDGWGMLLMDRLFRKQGRDTRRTSPLDRLAFIGENAMGALAFEPNAGEVLVPQDVQLIALAKEVRQVMTDDSEALLRELALMGGSPHGARPKVLVNHDPQSSRMSNSRRNQCASPSIAAAYAAIAAPIFAEKRNVGLTFATAINIASDANVAARTIARVRAVTATARNAISFPSTASGASIVRSDKRSSSRRPTFPAATTVNSSANGKIALAHTPVIPYPLLAAYAMSRATECGTRATSKR